MAALIRNDVCRTPILIWVAFFLVLIIIVGIIVFGVGTYTSIQSILDDYAAGAVRKWRQKDLSCEAVYEIQFSYPLFFL